MGAGQSTPSAPPAPAAAAPAPTSTTKPKPCCVCKEEKAARDDCMLFSNAADPQEDCIDKVKAYKACMKGFGFDI